MKSACLIILLFCAIPTHAQTERCVDVKNPSAGPDSYIQTCTRIEVTKKPWIKRYWKPLILTAAMTAARAAVTEASVHCQHVAPKGCVETNEVLGKHPSAAQTRAWGYGTAGLIGTANFGYWDWTGRDNATGLRWLELLWNMPLTIHDAQQAANDANAAAIAGKR